MPVRPIRGITVCVGYDDLLRITLIRNMRHLSECVVVTHASDHRTLEVVESVAGARAFITDAFYRDEAKFNKWLALEEGLDWMGRDGWLLVHDADILFPDSMPLAVEPGRLYSPPRLMLEEPELWSPSFSWAQAKRARDTVFAGYFHLFHADDPVLVSRPWYTHHFGHCGGGDYEFSKRWSPRQHVRPAFHVLHLGPRDHNWFGRVTPRLDQQPVADCHTEVEERRQDMQEMVKSKGWREWQK